MELEWWCEEEGEGERETAAGESTWKMHYELYSRFTPSPQTRMRGRDVCRFDKRLERHYINCEQLSRNEDVSTRAEARVAVYYEQINRSARLAVKQRTSATGIASTRQFAQSTLRRQDPEDRQ